MLTTGTATAITLLLLVGAAGKSAQIPLYVWLPDAMEGPTPVSALIHAATMVTAGVYLVARTGALFDLAPVSAAVVAVVGAATALLAATIAITQRDIKRVLAYSTVSQLGYMFMAVGAAGYVAGMFHLLTHAFFKALLFLGAGSVIHAMAGEQDMRKMGGLRKAMPVTFVTMVVAWLSIAGIPFFSGFWSKDEILAVLYQRGGWWIGLWALGLVTAAITGFYMSRMIYLTFFGEPRWDEGVRPHESPATMTLPLVGLAGLSAVAGLINTPFAPVLEHFLEPSFELVTQAQIPELRALWILAAVALAGGGGRDPVRPAALPGGRGSAGGGRALVAAGRAGLPGRRPLWRRSGRPGAEGVRGARLRGRRQGGRRRRQRGRSAGAGRRRPDPATADRVRPQLRARDPAGDRRVGGLAARPGSVLVSAR